MQLHNIKKNTANKKPKRVGRGGVHGKTSGRGTKGQNARAGRKKRPEMRDVIKRLPKLRGRGVNSFKSRKEKPLVITFSKVQDHFKTKEEITAKALLDKGLIKVKSGRLPVIKVLNG